MHALIHVTEGTLMRSKKIPDLYPMTKIYSRRVKDKKSYFEKCRIGNVEGIYKDLLLTHSTACVRSGILV